MSWIWDPNKNKVVAYRDKDGNEVYLDGYNENNTSIKLKNKAKPKETKKTEKELLREECDSKGIEYTSRMSIKQLKELLEANDGTITEND